MADTTPTTAIDGSKAVITWGSNTYHGIQNWSYAGTVNNTTVEFSSSSGISTITLTGTPEDTITFNMVVGQGDSESVAAFKRGESNSTCELHAEGDSAGNVEITFATGIVIDSSFGGTIGGPGILAVTIKCSGAVTITDAT